MKKKLSPTFTSKVPAFSKKVVPPVKKLPSPAPMKKLPSLTPMKKLPSAAHMKKETLPLSKTKTGLFRVFKSNKDGKYYWHLVSKNSQIVAQSEGYNQMPHAIKGVKAVIKCASEGVYLANNVLMRYTHNK